MLLFRRFVQPGSVFNSQESTAVLLCTVIRLWVNAHQSFPPLNYQEHAFSSFGFQVLANLHGKPKTSRHGHVAVGRTAGDNVCASAMQRKLSSI